MSEQATTRAPETTRAPRQVLFAYAAPALSSSFVFTAVSLFPVACHLLALILNRLKSGIEPRRAARVNPVS